MNAPARFSAAVQAYCSTLVLAWILLTPCTVVQAGCHVSTLALEVGCQAVSAPKPAVRVSYPNIVVILADDLGYGDVHCYNPDRGKIPTPNFDRLASQGIRFTDAHSSSGVCSPTRYSILTGRYHWRSRLQRGIVNIWEPPLIAQNRLTIPKLLKGRGYQTACIGKWHLGWDWPIDPATAQSLGDVSKQTKADIAATPEQIGVWQKVFSQPIAGGPTTRGFDAYFGTDVPNWPPFCFIENDRTVGIPSTFLPSRLFQHNQASLQGPALADWKLEPILPTLADHACEFISRNLKETKPFFLYLPLTSPHTPLAVNDAWKGKSGLNPYADFVMETDAAVGRVLDALDKNGGRDNTLVVFTSDNGCAPYIGVKELEAKGHYPSGPLRGYKSDAFEGGHRIPFIARWPGIVAAGSECQQTLCSVDLLATVASIVDAPLPDDAGEDSVSLLHLLFGEDRPIHNAVVHQSMQGVFAIRQGDWKLIFGPGSGGWSEPHDEDARMRNLPKVQLFDLKADLAESTNVADKHPEIVARLSATLKQFIADGRSTPGERQSNDVTPRLFKN